MSDYLTQTQLKEALKENNKLIVDEISENMNTMMERIDERFNRLEARVDRLEESHQKLLNTVDGFLRRLDEVETEQTARDAKFERLAKWAKEVSEKTGIPLPQL